MYKITLNPSTCTNTLDNYRTHLEAAIAQPFNGETTVRELMFSIQDDGFNIWLGEFEVNVSVVRHHELCLNFIEDNVFKFKAIWNRGEVKGCINQTLNWLINNIISANTFEVLAD